jgi:hypothetical protein
MWSLQPKNAFGVPFRLSTVPFVSKCHSCCLIVEWIPMFAKYRIYFYIVYIEERVKTLKLTPFFTACTPLYVCAISVDPAHLSRLIWICTGRMLVRNNLINQKANSADPDQTCRLWQLIWIYTVCPCYKGMYMEEMQIIIIVCAVQ